jgi:hypothetical protein
MGLELYRIMLRLRLSYGKKIPDGWHSVECNDEYAEVKIKNNKIVDIVGEAD